MTALKSRRVVTPEGIRPASVHIGDGRIVAVTDFAEGDDLGDLVLLPGLVDTHVHVNEPGRTEWEGFATATRAAAAGGVTTVVDMPLNSVPPTLDVASLNVKREVASGQCFVDVGFWGGAVPHNLGELRALWDAGVFGFKCFLAPSGVDEFPELSVADLTAAMVGLPEALFAVHAEHPAELGELAATRRYADFVDSRPPRSEVSAIEAVARAAAESGGRAHVVHVSAAESLPVIEAAKHSGVRLTVETCPHYLALAAEDVPDGATRFKCCPPIRGTANRDALWAALGRGLLDAVVSDHSPCTPALKRPDTGDFAQAWGGIASLQLGLPVVWTYGRARGYGLDDVVRWMAEGPARIAGLRHKGRIAVGAQADLVAFAPDEEFTVDANTLHHRHAVSPYDGVRLAGVVHRTWLAGRPVTPDRPQGTLLTR